jgi:hypothetical protein
MVRVLTLRADRLKPQDHNAAERIRSVKYPYYPNWNRNRDLPDCSTVPQINCAIAYRQTCSYTLKMYEINRKTANIYSASGGQSPSSLGTR